MPKWRALGLLDSKAMKWNSNRFLSDCQAQGRRSTTGAPTEQARDKKALLG